MEQKHQCKLSVKLSNLESRVIEMLKPSEYLMRGLHNPTAQSVHSYYNSADTKSSSK